jgi:hypothetical protein
MSYSFHVFRPQDGPFACTESNQMSVNFLVLILNLCRTEGLIYDTEEEGKIYSMNMNYADKYEFVKKTQSLYWFRC